MNINGKSYAIVKAKGKYKSCPCTYCDLLDEVLNCPKTEDGRFLCVKLQKVDEAIFFKEIK